MTEVRPPVKEAAPVGPMSHRRATDAPVMLLLRRIELANMVTVQGAHHADPGKHRGAAEIGDQHQRFDRGLPFGQGGLLIGKRSDVIGGVARRQTSVPPSGAAIGSSNLRLQPDRCSAISLAPATSNPT